MRPSPALCGRTKTRIGFTTKRVGGDFYRGNNTGSLGAHTQHGNYIVDWRKVRHFVVPELKNLRLTPFVSRGVYAHDTRHQDVESNPYDPRKFAGMHYLKTWKYLNEYEYDYRISQKDNPQPEEEYNEQQDMQEIPAETKTSETSVQR